MMIIIYLMILPIILLGLETDDKMNSRNDTNSESYVPKRKRGYGYRLKRWLNSRANEVYRWVIERAEMIKVKRKVRKRKHVAKRMNMPEILNPRGRRSVLRIIISYPAVAMLAGQHEKSQARQQRSVVFDTDADQIGIDNRCSACISHKIEDFIGNPSQTKRTIKGFGGARVSNIMSGTIKWQWLDDLGRVHKFKIPNSYYVPEGGVRLLSPQHWAQEQRKSNRKGQLKYGCDTSHNQSILYWEGNYKLTVPISTSNNVSTFNLAPGFGKFKLFCEKAEIEYDKECESPIMCNPVEYDSDDSFSDRDGSNSNLSWPHNHQEGEHAFELNEKLKEHSIDTNGRDRTRHKINDNTSAELLDLHQRYGHIGFSRLREMAKQGVISKKFEKCHIPTCSACLYAKATKRKWRDKSRKDFVENKVLNPGDRVSVDQLVSPTPGLVAQMTGILTTKRYKYATVFVDQATKLGYTYFQTSADAEETIKAKKAFEEFALQRGVQIRAYHADNGIFRANKWVKECRENGQPLTFAGVNAHHQNGIAERRIRSLQEMTRAMLIHANKKWSVAITPNLWPYAMRMANDSLNDTPNMQDLHKRSSEQIFSSTMVQHNVKHQKTFGCPTYVLDSKLQNGNIFHKWNSRSKVGIYLGRSPQHSRNVALILDRYTGLVSPQFHVVHDNLFETVTQENYESKWQAKAGFVSVTTKRSQGNKSTVPNQNTYGKMNHRKRAMDGPTSDTEIERRKIQKSEREARITRRNEAKDRMNDKSTSEGGRNSYPEGGNINSEGKNPKDNEPSIGNTNPIEDIESIVNETIMEDIQEIFCLEAMYPSIEQDSNPLLALKAVADPDVMYMHQAMKQEDKSEFVKAMKKEVDDQTKNGNFSIVERDSIPKGKTILNAVWQMRRKRDIKTRKIKKYKARLNIDGSKMRKGIDYDDTYAPVATWRTIRLILSLAAAHNWHTRQLDYVLAFPQAPVERELYMEIPKGFDVSEGNPKDYLLKIHRNIYGQKQAGRVWNQYLVEKLTNEIGFVQSKVDECLFYKGNVMYALYTDDSILAGPDKGEVDEIINLMKKAKLDITDEGNVEDFLGVNIVRREDGSVKLSQPHLIKQILSDLKMDRQPLKVKDTPAASSKVLHEHSKSVDFDNSFHYRSVIGKLNYLEKCTRPDISYATHQCARFTENPKVQHGKAVRWIARYLKGTMNEGIIMKPTKLEDLKLYVDADFSGNWSKDESDDRDSARSRHGYIVNYYGCPLLWKSQLQTEIALSSTESEYIGLSSGLREVIPIMRTLKEMKVNGFPIVNVNSDVHCRVFEDNSGALEMAKVHKYRPRTKHINVKFHHFRDYVERGEVTLHPIGTDNQPADMLTKPLNESILAKHRKFVMGW